MNSYIFIDGPVLWVFLGLLALLTILALCSALRCRRYEDKIEQLQEKNTRYIIRIRSLSQQLEDAHKELSKERFKRQLAECDNEFSLPQSSCGDSSLDRGSREKERLKNSPEAGGGDV